ncbi:Inhibitor of trypsin and hageman factor [Nymphaea thermarum]|nr:Inhibitor of trypsin and hageman factor [Nymphaea thermarum]
MDGQVASPIIKAQNPYVTDVPVVKERSIVLLNFRCDRARVWVKILRNQFLLINTGKSSWRELVGLYGKIAPLIIKAENPNVKESFVIKEGTFVPLDFRCDRVRVWVKPNGIIYKPPTIGKTINVFHVKILACS